MEKQTKVKIMTSILVLILGTIIGVYVSVNLHILLSSQKVDLNIFKIRDGIEIIKNDSRALKLFCCFELLILVSSIFYFVTDSKTYKSELIQITPEISIPIEAGQKQFGSARFMKEGEKRKAFTRIEIRQDKRIKDLLNHGYDDIKNLEGGD
ncbi:hypothetical protein ACR77J_13940 [Tissierella praeacuta]|uniref:hypothetical protein n=1 Tax=Tissierella praeacuta TaxID=43131 RepID=UPI0028A9611A|nr:hypothetical protein [Tissierella praeacuta]